MTDPTHRTEEQTSWRICRRELPKYNERVLVAYGSKQSAWTNVCVGRRSHTDHKGEHWEDDTDRPFTDNTEVFAWMPLPEVPCER